MRTEPAGILVNIVRFIYPIFPKLLIVGLELSEVRYFMRRRR